MTIVAGDLDMRRCGRRAFRVTSAGKVRFAVGIAPMILTGLDVRMTTADYAYLSGLSKGTYIRAIDKDASIARIVCGEEKKIGPGPLKAGPPAELVSHMLRDQEFKRSMKDDHEFRTGFFDGLVKLAKDDEIVVSGNMIRFALVYERSFKSRQLLIAFKEYRTLLDETVARISAPRDQRNGHWFPDGLGSGSTAESVMTRRRFVQNCTTASVFLSTLSAETKAAIHDAMHGDLSARLAHSVMKVDMAEFRSAWSSFLRIAAMLYFVAPWATDEFVKYTEWDLGL